jgi:superfamily I DNA/RNA helicase/RecB family exonuclease
MAKLELRRRTTSKESFAPTPEQSEIITAPASAKILISGVAGSGKTETLIQRALHLLKNGVKPDRLLILTFGRDRADYLRDEIALGAKTIADEPLARTFPALAFSILRMALDGEVRDPILLSGAEQDQVIRELLKTDLEENLSHWPELYQAALSTRGFAKELRELISRAKEWDLTPDQLLTLGIQEKEELWKSAARFWKRYEEVGALRDSGVADPKERIDPSELINRAHRYLVTKPELQRQVEKLFDIVLIDEFQESDPAHRRLLKIMNPKAFSIFYDIDSTASRFRGADPEGLPQFLATFEHGDSEKVLRYSLENSFRNCEEVEVSEHSSIADQSRYIVEKFRSHHLRDGVAYSDMAVIVRSPGEHLSALRRALSMAGIPVHQEAGTFILAQSGAIKPILMVAEIALGRKKFNRESYLEFEELLFSEFCGLDPLKLKQLRLMINQNREEGDLTPTNEIITKSLFDSEVLPIFFASSADQLSQFKPLLDLANLIKRVRRVANQKNSTVTDIFWEIWSNAKNSEGLLIKDIWRQRALSSHSSYESGSADRDLDAVIELFESARRHVERFPDSKPDLFIDELKEATILGDVIAPKGDRSDQVTLTTVHSSKGYQWQIVAIIGMQEGSWPNLKARGSLLGSERLVDIQRYGNLARKELSALAMSALIEDENRLFHLAKTRASKKLLITAVTREDEEPSQFFYDEFEVHPAKIQESGPLTGNGKIAQLRITLGDLKNSESERKKAAKLLKALSLGGFPAAKPERWLGFHPVSSESPLVSESEPIYLSPSEIEKFSECQLRWFFEKFGAQDGQAPAALLGSALHAYAKLIGDGELELDEAINRLAKTWHLIDSNSGWIHENGLASAVRTLTRFFQWQSGNPRELLGTEVGFELSLGRVIIRGSADRLEIDDNNRIIVVDLKTGKNVETQKTMAQNKQLATYQMALTLGAAEDIVAGRQLGGAELVYPGTDSKSITIRSQGIVDVDSIKAEVVETASSMVGPIFIATINPGCQQCLVRILCPAQNSGRAVCN